MRIILITLFTSNLLFGQIDLYEKEIDSEVEVIDQEDLNIITFKIPYLKRKLLISDYSNVDEKSLILSLKEPFIIGKEKELILMRIGKINIVRFSFHADKTSMTIYPDNLEQKNKIILFFKQHDIKQIPK